MSHDEVQHGPVLHVVVVGFHHKRGGQVEYSYPPLIPGKPVNSNELPRKWHYLPAVALPDGAHNYTEDTVYFHLPSLDQDNHTVYGVSCCRQMDSKKLVNRGSDVTRNTVQKSVCVLSRLPLYGLIQAKLELITHAYFEELDFTKTSLLQDTYDSLNSSLSGPHLMRGSQVFLSLSSRALIQTLGHKALVLYKLMLLERKVLFFSSPVKPICTTMLALLSLFPDMIERGLSESARYLPSMSVSPTLRETRLSGCIHGDEYLEVSYSETKERSGSIRSCDLPQDLDLSGDTSLNCNTEVFLSDQDTRYSCHPRVLTDVKLNSGALTRTEIISDDLKKMDVCTSKRVAGSGDAGTLSSQPVSCHPTEDSGIETDPVGLAFASTDNVPSKPTAQSHNLSQHQGHDRLQSQGPRRSHENSERHHEGQGHSPHRQDDDNVQQLLDSDDVEFDDKKLMLEIESTAEDEEPKVHYYHSPQADNTTERLPSQSSISSLLSPVSLKAAEIRDKMVAALSGEREDHEAVQMRHITEPGQPTETGFPLKIFSKGMLCHPYLCLQNYDLLSDLNVRGYVVGATNMLFKQKRHLLDVIVEVNEGEIIIHDPDLRRQLTLTTADLRFAEYLSQMCAPNDDSDYLDDTEWEGGDEWIRAQFTTYLTSLLSTTALYNEKFSEDFNSHFVSAWKTTHNYKTWHSLSHVALNQAVPGHPFRGQLVMADVKLRLSHSMQHTEGGKKINAAMSQTGKVMVQTGKAVGGALTSAKSAVSRTFSSWFNNSQPDEQKDEDSQEK